MSRPTPKIFHPSHYIESRFAEKPQDAPFTWAACSRYDNRVVDLRSLFAVPLLARALAGFLVSGYLFGLLGALLPSWGYHISADYFTVGAYFISVTAGMILFAEAARRLAANTLIHRILTFGCALATAALLYLALLPAINVSGWRMAGLFLVGGAAGLLNTGLFRAIAPGFEHDRAATITLGGIFFGIGCLASALLIAQTFYTWSLTAILLFLAAIPAGFAFLYSRQPFPALPLPEPTFRQALDDFRSPGAILFALLLFFQFGNEWSIAGWLPIYLVHQIGISPEDALLLLALFWLALLIGRLIVLSLLPRSGRAKLLLASSGAAILGCVILLLTNKAFGASIGILLVGGGFAAIYPLVAEKIGSRFPYYHPGFFNGIFSFALVGGLLAPGILGFFAAQWGIGIVMTLPLLGTVMVFALLLLLWLEQKVTG